MAITGKSVNFPNCPQTKPSMPRITALLPGGSLNIANMANVSRGAYAYTVVDVEHRPSEALIEKLSALETMYRVRLIG